MNDLSKNNTKELFEKVRPFLHYYAGRFQNSRFDHWELINEARLRICKYGLPHPKYASAGIRWAMISYMKQQRSQDHRRNVGAVILSLDLAVDERSMKSFVIQPETSTNNIDDERKWLNLLIDGSGLLSLDDKQLINEHYFQGKSVSQMARERNVSPSAMSWRKRKILKILRDKANIKVA